jgi:hypothetical protein
MNIEERLAALESRVAYLEANRGKPMVFGPIEQPSHGQISLACKYPMGDHSCTWKSCGCACHKAKDVPAGKG